MLVSLPLPLPGSADYDFGVRWSRLERFQPQNRSPCAPLGMQSVPALSPKVTAVPRADARPRARRPRWSAASKLGLPRVERAKRRSRRFQTALPPVAMLEHSPETASNDSIHSLTSELPWTFTVSRRATAGAERRPDELDDFDSLDPAIVSRRCAGDDKRSLVLQ